jgi:hypothetical protein
VPLVRLVSARQWTDWLDGEQVVYYINQWETCSRMSLQSVLQMRPYVSTHFAQRSFDFLILPYGDLAQFAVG